jgi:hypothetical protein
MTLLNLQPPAPIKIGFREYTKMPKKDLTELLRTHRVTWDHCLPNFLSLEKK